ncbi:helix-turn-helix domain-containing protein [Natroniella acetigena]|uniref:helix-turn-helix domain-containing protein n=1 Tax=Natroniella acetigena TaxID=52004 RepID=UPI00200B85F6|nr:helix-turn-helix transcriptional regulator [Natroniella acetigena]MCK8826363.1 helix-turn-helix domain-containing protein [Natroniella acetigena]
MSFGKRLKKLRKEKGLKQDDLAKMINKSKSTISSYESERRIPDINVVAELADLFHVDVDYLIGKTDVKRDKTDKIRQALKTNPELAEYWEEVTKRETLQLMFDQAKDLPDEAIQDVIRIMMRIDKEEGNY